MPVFTSAIRRALRASAATACAVLGLSAVAQAQNTPKTTATPPPHSKYERNASQHKTFSNLPIVDIVPIFTQPAPYDTAAQTKGYDPLDVGGTVQIPLTPRLSYSFDRLVEGAFNQAPDRIIVNGVASYPSDYRDAIIDNRLDYNVTPQLVLETGLQFRHREDSTAGVSGAPFPATVSSTESHMAYLSATYTTIPISALGGSRFLFNVQGERQPVDHHVAVLNSARTVSYIDENPHQNDDYEMTEQVGLIVPVDPRHGFTFSARQAWGAVNFYENMAAPWRLASGTTLALTKKFSPLFSLTMRMENSIYDIEGTPFPVPNAVRTQGIDILGDFHIDLNSLVHND